jgi:integrase/recombinase XerD
MQQEFAQAVALRDNTLWKQLESVTIRQACEAFLSTLTFHTKRSYASMLKKVFSHGHCSLTMDSTLQSVALCNLESVLDEIKQSVVGSEMTKQHACKVFISFTSFLQRHTKGMIRKAIPKKGVDATFVRVRDKSVTRALKMEEWVSFIRALYRLSYRDYLIAKTIFQGAKRLSEVLGSKIENIDWENCRISFKQLKSKFLEKQTVISYPKEFMEELKRYLNGRCQGHIFVTRGEKAVTQPHIHRSFAYASIRADLPFRVHPHVLRASAITLFIKMGYHSDDIMKISGHCDTKAVLYYDKNKIEENITQQVRLI